MKTTIKNNERIFLLTGDMGIHFICNIEEFRNCLNLFDDREEVKIQHLWNNRFVNCSKKSVVEMAYSTVLHNPFRGLYTVKCKFKGRLNGSIGKFYTIYKTIQVINISAVESVLYSEFDHIQELKTTLIN